MVGKEMLRNARPDFMKSEAAGDGCGAASQSRLYSPFRLTACAVRNEMPASRPPLSSCDHDF